MECGDEMPGRESRCRDASQASKWRGGEGSFWREIAFSAMGCRFSFERGRLANYEIISSDP